MGDPRVDAAWVEGDGDCVFDNGRDEHYWIALKAEWVWAPETHNIHEGSIRAALQVLNNCVYPATKEEIARYNGEIASYNPAIQVS